MKYLLLPILLYLMGAVGFGLMYMADHWDQEMAGNVLFIWSLEEGIIWPVRFIELFSQT